MCPRKPSRRSEFFRLSAKRYLGGGYYVVATDFDVDMPVIEYRDERFKPAAR
jgi:hypothetical protein